MRLESDSSRICRSPLRASIIIDCDVRCSVSPAKLYSGGPAAEYPTRLPPRPLPRTGCVSVYVAKHITTYQLVNVATLNILHVNVGNK